MANARTAWGIDIGNRALKAVKLIRDGDQIRIDDYEIVEHEQVLSNSGDNRESLIQSALASFVQRHAARDVPVAVSVSGQQSFARFIKLPPVEAKKIPEIVRFEAIQQIPFPLDDVEWSYQLFQNPDSPDVEVGIFAMRKDLVNQHIKYFTDVDLNVQLVQMGPLAVYNAMVYDGRVKDTTMIVDLGAENTDLIIADGQTVWLRSIPIGGNNFTEALVKSFKLNFAKAEELKRNAATSKYARQIFQAMRPVFADLVSEIQRSIGFYASVHRESRIKRVLALGATFRLPGLQKYLQQNLQLDVERLDALGAGLPAEGRSPAAFSENLLSMVTAYGLALQSMGETRIDSSLLPGAIRRAKLWKEKTKWFAAAAALFVLGTGVAYGSLWWTGKQAEEAQNRHGTEIANTKRDADSLSAKWDAVESSGSADREQIKQVSALLKYRTIWNDLLGSIYSALPQPQPDVLQGYLQNKKELITTPRGERQLVMLDVVSSQYMGDLTLTLKENDPKAAPMGGPDMSGEDDAAMIARHRAEMMADMAAGPRGGAGPAAAAPAGPSPDTPHGYVIMIRGTTPNSGLRDGSVYDFLDKHFLASLVALKNDERGQKRGYYVAKATILTSRKIKDSPERLAALKAALDAQLRGVPAAGAGAGFLTNSGPAAMGGMGSLGPMGGRGVGSDNMDAMMEARMRAAAEAEDRRYEARISGGGRAAPVAPGVPGVPGAPGAAGAAPEQDPYVDRITGENVLGDSEFTARLVILLDAKPEEKKAE